MSVRSTVVGLGDDAWSICSGVTPWLNAARALGLTSIPSASKLDVAMQALSKSVLSAGASSLTRMTVASPLPRRLTRPSR